MRKAAFLLLVLVLAAGPAAPARAEGIAPSYGAAVGGIEPVSPDQFAGKLQDLGDKLYKAVSPVTDTAAKIALAIAGLLLVATLAVAPGLAGRVVGAMFGIALGVCLWYCAPYIVGLLKYFALWIQS